VHLNNSYLLILVSYLGDIFIASLTHYMGQIIGALWIFRKTELWATGGDCLVHYVFFIVVFFGGGNIFVCLFSVSRIKWVLVTQSCLTLCNPMDYIAPKAPLSIEFSREAYWSGFCFFFFFLQMSRIKWDSETKNLVSEHAKLRPNPKFLSPFLCSVFCFLK